MTKKDIVERLRAGLGPTEDWPTEALLFDAADEIERLREGLGVIEQGPDKNKISMTQEALIARRVLAND